MAFPDSVLAELGSVSVLRLVLIRLNLLPERQVREYRHLIRFWSVGYRHQMKFEWLAPVAGEPVAAENSTAFEIRNPKDGIGTVVQPAARCAEQFETVFAVVVEAGFRVRADLRLRVRFARVQIPVEARSMESFAQAQIPAAASPPALGVAAQACILAVV